MTDFLGQVQRRALWKGQRQAMTLVLLALFMVAVIGALYLAQVAETSTTGRRLEALLIERDELEQTNETLRVEIAELRSVPRLIARAQELGFDYAARGEIEYLMVEGYTPDRSQTVAPLRELVEEDVLQYDETFTGWLRQQVDRLDNQFESFAERGTQ